MKATRLATALAVLTATAVAGCTSSGSPSATSSGQTSGPTSTGTTQCTAASAASGKQTLISSAGFSPSCVAIKAGTNFFFVDNDGKNHTATTKPGAPVAFDADLKKKGSTYASKFRKKGTYHVYDKVTKSAMTLIVK